MYIVLHQVIIQYMRVNDFIHCYEALDFNFIIRVFNIIYCFLIIIIELYKK